MNEDYAIEEFDWTDEDEKYYNEEQKRGNENDIKKRK